MYLGLDIVDRAAEMFEDAKVHGLSDSLGISKVVQRRVESTQSHQKLYHGSCPFEDSNNYSFLLSPPQTNHVVVQFAQTLRVLYENLEK